MGDEAVGTSGRLIRPASGVLVFGFLVVSCDIVQGFENAGDALFPPVKTYLDTPGYRLVEGGYRDLNFVAGDELYLLARPADPEDQTLYSMSYADPKPCSIPEVGRYYPAEDTEGGTTWITYFHGTGTRGDLNFADPRCNLSTLVLPDAELPLAVRSWRLPSGQLAAESDRTLILRQGEDLVAVDPGEPSQEVLVTAAGQVMQAVGGASVNYVFSEGQIVPLDMNWRPPRAFTASPRPPTAIRRCSAIPPSTGTLAASPFRLRHSAGSPSTRRARRAGWSSGPKRTVPPSRSSCRPNPG
jgi:hypothetical protein